MSLGSKAARAAELLAGGMQCKDVAERVGVTPQTISAWKNKPEFEATINRLSMECLKASRQHLQALAVEATETLADLMKSGNGEAIRLKAAQAVLHHVGLTDRKSGQWAWGIGPQTAEEIQEENTRRLNMPSFKNLLEECGYTSQA